MALASLQPAARDRDRGFCPLRACAACPLERLFERLYPDEEHQEKHHLGRRRRREPARARLSLRMGRRTRPAAAATTAASSAGAGSGPPAARRADGARIGDACTRTGGGGSPGGADLAADRADHHRPAGDPAAAAQIHPRPARRHLCGRRRQRSRAMAEQPVSRQPLLGAGPVERSALCPENRRPRPVLCAGRRLLHSGARRGLYPGQPGVVLRSVGAVPAGVPQDRADRQLLDRRRQIADTDRRRIRIYI